jgi:glucokinase
MPPTANALAAPLFLAADVGGTHARVGLIQPPGNAGAAVTLLAHRKYRCADYPSLAAILADFLRDCAPVSVCVIASAGLPLADGTVVAANLPWPLAPAAIAAELGLASVHLINDFEALGYATTQVDASQVLQLCGPAQAPRAPVLILGPGTGLGAALWLPVGPRATVLATEAGQAALAMRSPLEIALLQVMQREHGHVSNEHAISGPGLLRLYRALCTLRGQTAVHATPDAVSAAALAGDDALAVEALNVFCALLGSLAGDLALAYAAQGGVYLAGGILPQLQSFLLQSAFVPRFLDKGPMRAALEQVPVKLVDHGELGIIGAAHWYLQQR